MSFRSTIRRLAVVSVPSLIAVCVSAETRVTVPFPATQQTTIGDCVTPTVIDLGGGQTVTFEGGQFIQYDDGVFRGIMYASSSAAGCQRSAFGAANMYYLSQNQQYGSIKITFSPPVAHADFDAYNFAGETQTVEAIWLGPNNEQTGGGGVLPDRVVYAPFFGYPPYTFWPTAQFIGIGMLRDFTLPPLISPSGYYIGWWTDHWAYGITAVRVPQLTPDTVKFDFPSTSGGDDGKILLSKAPWDVAYPSQYQVRGSSGPQVRVTGTLVDGRTKQPKSGMVYLRVNDPPDTAPYRGGDAHDGDNEKHDSGALTGATAGVAKVQTDAAGHFETTLTITSNVAGDNYQVVGAPNDSFSCPGACPKSGVFTLWKRVYLEEEHMFRQGAFIADVVARGDTSIPVDDPAPFRALQQGAALELVHGDTGSGEGFYADLVSFAGLVNANGQWAVNIDAATPVPRFYGARPTPSHYDQVRRDGLGVVAAGAYEANHSYTVALFASMFVDIIPDHAAITEVPYIEQLSDADRAYYSNRWLQDGLINSPYTSAANPNVLHRIAASQGPFMSVQFATGPAYGADLGVTNVGTRTNSSFIWVQRIEDMAAGLTTTPNGTVVQTIHGLDPLVVNGETTAHETVHFWVHAPDGVDAQGHCSEQGYANNSLSCLLHVPTPSSVPRPEYADGLVDLHYIQHGANSEYMAVRKAPDPVPQQ